MSDTAPEIKVTLTAEDKGVAAAIKELGNQLSALKQKQNEVAESSLNLKGAFDAVISSAIVLKVIEFGKEVFQTSLQIDRLSQRTGLSAGFLSTFSKAAEGSGVSTDQVSNSLGRLATNIVKFQQGGTQAAAAMKALGVSQGDLKNLSPEQAIRLVTDRLGSMQSGLQKAAIAQTLMGRGGQALLPVLNSLAGEGFDRVTAAAKATGQFLTDDMAANTLAAASAMNELAGAAKGAATQFEAGLEPAIIEIGESLKDNLQSNGASGFTALGEKAGTVLRYVALLFLDIGTSAGGMVAVVKEEFDQMWREIELGGETVANAIKSGSFKGAWNALIDGGKKAVKESEDDSGRLRAIFDQTGAQLAKNFDQLIPSDDEEKKRQAARTAKFAPKPPGAGEPDPNDNKANKAALSALEARLQEELALFKANNSAEESANQIAYSEGLESARAFFARKKQLAQAESAEQIAILQRERTAVAAAPTDGTNAGDIAQKQKLAKFDSEIAIAKVNATKTQAEIDSQLFLAEEQHQKQLQGYQAEILKAQGLTYEAAVAQIQGEAAEVKRNLVQAGLSPEAVASLLAQIQQLKLASAAFDQDKKQGEDALKSLTNERDEINIKVQTGQISQINAEQQIIALEKQRVPTLYQIAAAMKAAAVTPEQKQAAADFARQIDGIAAATDLAGQRMAQFKNQTVQSLQGDLSTFLGSTIDHVKGIGDAFGQLANSVVGSIQKIVAQLIIQIAFQKLAAAAASGGGGIGGLFSALKFAEGGVVPGVGNTDSVPAMLMPGEFVVSKAAVQALGVQHLATINQGVRVPSIAGMAIPHFAEGGLVQGRGSVGSSDINLGIGLDEGLVLKHLSSKAAGRVLLRHLASNPKAASKAISRGQ